MEVDKTSRNISKLLFGLLAIAFVILKLTKVISWSWWVGTVSNMDIVCDKPYRADNLHLLYLKDVGKATLI